MEQWLLRHSSRKQPWKLSITHDVGTQHAGPVSPARCNPARSRSAPPTGRTFCSSALDRCPTRWCAQVLDVTRGSHPASAARPDPRCEDPDSDVSTGAPTGRGSASASRVHVSRTESVRGRCPRVPHRPNVSLMKLRLQCSFGIVPIRTRERRVPPLDTLDNLWVRCVCDSRPRPPVAAR